jgi:uncharacterized protein YjbI with pentapeptide repeats
MRSADTNGRRIRSTLTVLGLLVIFGLALWQIPKSQVTSLSYDPPKENRSRFELENEARKTLAQILGGGFFLLTAYLTWRSVRATERNVGIAQGNLAVVQRNLALAQETQEQQRQVTQANLGLAQANLEAMLEKQTAEHYGRSIEHLGSETELVRIGGIYALERIAQGSALYHWPIMEVLTAYVREHSLTADDDTPANHEGRPPRAAGIRAAIAVLVRRTRTFGRGEDRQLDLSRARLRGTYLGGAHLEGAILWNADLTVANLTDAHLEDARLTGATLIGAILLRADLSRAVLSAANLSSANLSGAMLGGANLSGVTLAGADLSRASLARANVSNVDLKAVDLEAVDLGGVLYDRETRWPNGCDPRARGALKLGPDAELGGADLHEADLRHSDLRNGHLRGANLMRADLRGATLDGADLHDAVLTDAVYSRETRWPDGYDPRQHGAVLDLGPAIHPVLRR